MFQSTLVQSNLDNKVGIVHCHQIICWLEINGCKIILISAKDKFPGFLMHENKSMNCSNLITTMTIYYFREILTELVHNKRWETKSSWIVWTLSSLITFPIDNVYLNPLKHAFSWNLIKISIAFRVGRIVRYLCSGASKVPTQGWLHFIAYIEIVETHYWQQ